MVEDNTIKIRLDTSEIPKDAKEAAAIIKSQMEDIKFEIKEKRIEKGYARAEGLPGTATDIERQILGKRETLLKLEQQYKRYQTALKEQSTGVNKVNTMYAKYRKALTGVLIDLHMLRIVGQSSRVVAASFQMISQALGYLLDMILLPLLPYMVRFAMLIYRIGTWFAHLDKKLKMGIAVVVGFGVALAAVASTLTTVLISLWGFIAALNRATASLTAKSITESVGSAIKQFFVTIITLLGGGKILQWWKYGRKPPQTGQGGYAPPGYGTMALDPVETLKFMAAAAQTIRGGKGGIGDIFKERLEFWKKGPSPEEIMKGIVGFQEGGIVKSSTLANVGEAGPEAIIPLDKLGETIGNLVSGAGGFVSSIFSSIFGGAVAGAVPGGAGVTAKEPTNLILAKGFTTMIDSVNRGFKTSNMLVAAILSLMGGKGITGEGGTPTPIPFPWKLDIPNPVDILTDQLWHLVIVPVTVLAHDLWKLIITVVDVSAHDLWNLVIKPITVSVHDIWKLVYGEGTPTPVPAPIPTAAPVPAPVTTAIPKDLANAKETVTSAVLNDGSLWKRDENGKWYQAGYAPVGTDINLERQKSGYVPGGTTKDIIASAGAIPTTIQKDVETTADKVRKNVETIADKIADTIKEPFVNAAAFTDQIESIEYEYDAAVESTKDLIKRIPGIGKEIVSTLDSINNWLDNTFGGLSQSMGLPAPPPPAPVPIFQSGGIMPHTGYAYLHAGETVTPAGETGTRGNINIYNPVFQISGKDDRQMFESFMRIMKQEGMRVR